MNVYLCVNRFEPWERPVLLVKATRAKWAAEKAGRFTGLGFGWVCIRVRGVSIDGEVAEATPGMLRDAVLNPPPGFYRVPKQVVDRLNSLALEVAPHG